VANRIIRWLFWLSLSVAAALVLYKLYLNFFEQDFAGEHAVQVERIEAVLEGRTRFRFAVLGNISNSVGIFERKIIPLLNEEKYDFVVSAGNAVSSGAEDKYRALYRTLSRLEMPYLLTFGPLEQSRIGGFRFYEHFGPYLFGFAAGNSRLIFLDSTGTTDFAWQFRWLEEELAAAREPNLFLFSAHPLQPVDRTGLFGFGGEYLFEEPARTDFTRLIEQNGVDAVFSADLPLFDRQTHAATTYTVTGGAGGLVLNNGRSRYHYVSVEVEEDRVTISEKPLAIGQSPFWRRLESLWFFIHSLFYVGYLNFILLVSSVLAVALWLHRRIFVERDYYPDFDIDPDALDTSPLRIAMFTNNYLPFIGGVPISIERLRRGLLSAGQAVRVIAPAYSGTAERAEEGILRIPSLLPLGRHREFRLANIFLPRLYRYVHDFAPQLIHVHHPFWLGRTGLILGRRFKVPVIYTYHTRLEHYAHYVPLPGPLFRNLISHALIKRFANRCDAVIVPTTAAEEYLRIIGVKSPIFVQPTGIEYERFAHADSEAVEKLRAQLGLGNAPVLISISRLSREKNIDFMLDGLKLLHERGNTPFRLLLIGEGSERPHLQARIDALGLSDRVTLVGAVAPELVPLYCRLGELFVFASRSETQGMVILEAMAAGLPVVVVRASGIDDIVHQGHNGYKTPLQLSDWCRRIETLLLDEPLRQRLAKQAQGTAAEHGTDRFARAVLQIYRYAIALKNKR